MFDQKTLPLKKEYKNQGSMATIKVVIRKRKNAQGLHPIIIRINHNKKSSILTTGQVIEDKHWDNVKQRVRKSHPNATRLNNFILKKLAEANDKLLEMTSNKESVTSRAITKEIKSKKKSTSFFELAEIYMQQLLDKQQFTRVTSEKSRIKHFKTFLKDKEITFPEITEVLLKRFQAYLKNKRGNSDRTIVNTLIVIRTIFNLAIREGIVERKYYPFGNGGIATRFPQSVKIGLSKEDVKKLEEVKLEAWKEHHARNIWLTSFYFAGMRISDVLRLKWSDFKDDRLYYRMGKNNKTLSLKVPDKAAKIIEEYREDRNSTDDFIFPEVKKADLTNPKDISTKIANGNKNTNKYLKLVAEKIELDKPLTMHIARHTFGHISGDRIPVQVLQMLYRHSDITTTINYQNNFTHKQADDALDAVLNS